MIVKNSCSKITVLMEPNKCKFYITISSVNVKNYFYIIIKSTYPPMSNTRVLIGSILISLSYPSPSIKLSLYISEHSPCELPWICGRSRTSLYRPQKPYKSYRNDSKNARSSHFSRSGYLNEGDG